MVRHSSEEGRNGTTLRSNTEAHDSSGLCALHASTCQAYWQLSGFVYVQLLFVIYDIVMLLFIITFTLHSNNSTKTVVTHFHMSNSVSNKALR